MKEIKKYTSIIRYGNSSTREVLQKGDIIHVSEKLDGANVSFVRDENNFLGVTSYSRKQALTPENTLRGFYNWVRENIAPMKDDLHPSFRYYGEWLCPHKVKYKEKYVKQFFLFSIWDEDVEQYLSDDIVEYEAERLGLQTVDCLYYGEFISFEHLMSFVGQSRMTLEPNKGEGIVVKNAKYFNRNNEQVFVKLVSKEFSEIQKQKAPKDPNINSEIDELIKTVLTKARVEKLMYKLVDEELIVKEDFEIEKMGLLLRLLGSRVLEDMIKEELEILISIEESVLKKRVGKILPLVVKEVLKEY